MKLIFLLGCLCISAMLNAQGTATKTVNSKQKEATEQKLTKATFDDIDVLHYQVILNITDFVGKRIFGNTTVQLKAINNLDSVVLFLETLKVDSILYDNKKMSFKHAGYRLAVSVPGTKANEVFTLKIYYGGTPRKDATWGGFYFSGVYAFNLGVGFTSEPHNFGRVWFPCVDNFTDRATYSFEITTTSDKKAMCNGILQKTEKETNGNLTWFWNMTDPIPTYLASVAVAPYTINSYIHKNIPVTLSAIKADSLKMAASFENLPLCIDAYNEKYGAHNFQRIGFNLVPFNGGAMEHATNIAYPIFGADGEKSYETLYAHELAHHWWGNTVTCRTPEDMWLNEGWASYSERIFLEWVYGKERYKEDVSSNHFDVVHHAHLRDGDTLPISGIGHTHTYGSHVYNKGADVVHTLRGYMGDDAFFKATNSFIETYKFKDVSSQDLKLHFQNYTQQNLTAFFDNWVFNRGFPVFDILEWKVKKVGNVYESQIRIRQRSRFNPKNFTDVPLDLTALSSDFKQHTTEVSIKTNNDYFTIETPFEPITWCIDINEKISDAITDHAIIVKDTGRIDFKDGLMTMHVNQSKDSSYVRVEHVWVGPDAWFNGNNNPFLSRERYWKVDGIWNEKFKASATITYNGRNTGTNYASGYFDNDLIRIREDSLVLMYRTTPSSAWEIEQSAQQIMGSPFDKIGTFVIPEVRKGEYALAIKDANLLSVFQPQTETEAFLRIYPNPTSDKINFEVKGAPHTWLEVTSANGTMIHREQIKSKKCVVSLDTNSWARGVYYVGLVVDNTPYKPKLFMVY